MRVVATAGHVDHGKSTLVQALTGTDPDRLAEEKERGLTIDLGFAGTRLPSGTGVAFVDVPGHVRFLKNMLAGVGAVDACLFVVAATEGWKPQSEEHLRILELLGVRHGVIALTKVAAVDDELKDLAELDVVEHAEGSFLDGAEMVAVDAPAGMGLDSLRAALDRLLAEAPRQPDRDRPRLWIDRSFAAAGAGTVVTGTLTGGSLHVEDELTVEPLQAPVRVRALQRLHQNLTTVEPGNRTAVNLVGVDHRSVQRGHVLVRHDQWHRTATVDAELTVLAGLDHAVGRRGAYKAYVGSGEHDVALRVLGEVELEPGATGLVRLHLDTVLPLLPGDRYVLRESGRSETVGGGEILDVDPVRRAVDARPDRTVERVVAERGWVRADDLERLTGVQVAPEVGEWVVDPRVLAVTEERLASAVREAGPMGLDLASFDERDRLVLDRLGEVVIESGRAVVGGQVDPLADHPWVAALQAEPFAPPAAVGLDRNEVRELVRRGTVVEVDGVAFAASALELAAARLAELLSTRPDGVTVAEVRDALGTTRKYVLPLLNHFDRTGVTRRRSDLRIAGPRLPMRFSG